MPPEPLFPRLRIFHAQAQANNKINAELHPAGGDPAVVFQINPKRGVDFGLSESAETVPFIGAVSFGGSDAEVQKTAEKGVDKFGQKAVLANKSQSFLIMLSTILSWDWLYQIFIYILSNLSNYQCIAPR